MPFEKERGDDHGVSDAMSLVYIATETTRSNHSGKPMQNGKDCLAGTVVNASSMKEQDEIRREVLFRNVLSLMLNIPPKSVAGM